MDRKHLTNPRILTLQERSARSRSTIQAEYRMLRKRIDMPARMLASLRHQPGRWILGSSIAGIAAGLFLPKSRPKALPAPAPAAPSRRLLGFAWSAIQPVAKAWLANQLRIWLAARTRQSPPRS